MKKLNRIINVVLAVIILANIGLSLFTGSIDAVIAWIVAAVMFYRVYSLEKEFINHE